MVGSFGFGIDDRKASRITVKTSGLFYKERGWRIVSWGIGESFIPWYIDAKRWAIPTKDTASQSFGNQPQRPKKRDIYRADLKYKVASRDRKTFLVRCVPIFWKIAVPLRFWIPIACSASCLEIQRPRGRRILVLLQSKRRYRHKAKVVYPNNYYVFRNTLDKRA